MKNIKFRKKNHFDIRTNVIMYIIIEKQQYINYAVFVVKKLLREIPYTFILLLKNMDINILIMVFCHFSTGDNTD
jgi:hypothetical protein